MNGKAADDFLRTYFPNQTLALTAALPSSRKLLVEKNLVVTGASKPLTVRTIQNSCERAFNPRLDNVPVVVLSNNDDCAVARSNEVKALGVMMGAPWFKLKALAHQLGIVALSSNYTLYGI
ncbi:hypothetical protein RCH06_002506 [Polaromonas sp. CG_9.5]|nr:hypothetical protein [Polaromonas sp. CG_9.5]